MKCQLFMYLLILLLVKSRTVRVPKDSLPHVSKKQRIPASPTAQCSKDISVRWWHPLSKLWARNRNWYGINFVLCRLKLKRIAEGTFVEQPVLTRTSATRGTDWVPWSSVEYPWQSVGCIPFGNCNPPSWCCNSVAVGVNPADCSVGNQAECDL